MNLLDLLNRLPTNIQNVIKTYYLSYGTHTANILRSYLTTLPTDSNMTVWKHKMLRHPYVEIKRHRKSGFISVFELNIAFLADEPDSDSKGEKYRENNMLLNTMFKAKMHSLMNPTFYGTPTAIIMRDCIPNFTKYDSQDKDNITIWRIKVRTGGVLTDKKINDLKPVCNTQVYNELTAAYNEYKK
jgi:hypothetical protein